MSLFAVTIGIDDYPNAGYTKLYGSVADANAVETYLRRSLQVDASQIISLRNREATRAAILQAFKALKDDYRIQRQNPILIYFAGHGGEARAPEGWPCSEGKVQMIIPYDCGLKSSDGQVIHGIPDLTIGWHLKCLAEAKGDNITVIFDNCFSGSGTRSLDIGTTSSTVIRAVVYAEQLPKTLDSLHSGNIQRGLQVAPGYTHSGHRSHVLLAACKRDEYAREVNKRGVFTKALLEAMSGIDISRITYTHLIQSIPHLSSNQNPQCEGHLKSRLIFDAKVPTPQLCFQYKGRRDVPSGRLIIGADIGQGLGIDDTLSIWRNIRDYENQRALLGTAQVVKVEPSCLVELKATPEVQSALSNSHVFLAVLKESRRPLLYVYVHDMDPAMPVIQKAVARVMNSLPLHRADVVISQTTKKANLRITTDSDQQRIFFDTINDEVNQYGLQRLPHSAPSRANEVDFHRIFHRISIYEYYLRQVKGPSNMEGKICLEFVKLKKPVNTTSHENWDIGDIEADNLSIDGAGIDLMQDGSYYAIKLTNKTTENLYPSLFYFDNCDYSINLLYEPPSAGKHIADPPLKAAQSIVIGYGGEGVCPFVLDVGVRPHCPMEVGFLKLFISTKNVDYSHIQQESPFTDSNRGLRPFTKAKPDYCGSIIVPLVVRSQLDASSRNRRPVNQPELQRAARPATLRPHRKSVFGRVSFDQNHHIKLHKLFRKLCHPSLHWSMPLEQQFADMNVSQDRNRIQQVFRELQEMQKQIEGMRKNTSNLERERRGASEELKHLGERIRRIEEGAGLSRF